MIIDSLNLITINIQMDKDTRLFNPFNVLIPSQDIVGT